MACRTCSHPGVDDGPHQPQRGRSVRAARPANEEADIQAFVAAHRGLPNGARLSEAPFWTEAQARFLRDEIREDADWAGVVDQLNVMLHE